MKRVFLCGEQCESLAGKLREIFPQDILQTKKMEAAEEFDLVVLTKANAKLPKAALKCRVLLMPGEVRATELGTITPEWVASYGMSARDTITASSLDPEQPMLALQRELVSIDGFVHEQQEIAVQIGEAENPMQAMAFYGACLLLGQSPERLQKNDHK